MRLDRLIGKWGNWGKRRVREQFEAGEVSVNGECVEETARLVGKFDRVEVSGKVVQAETRRVVILNKPLGVVSATKDPEHPTVIDLIERPWASSLHLAGRLDRYTSGLMILTNDGEFSESLTEPAQKVGKRYLVEVDGVIGQEVAEVFEEGMWFAKEEITTAPAKVELIDDSRCRLIIYEGKHHQVKRMFARFDLKVIALHREAIGGIELPDDLPMGAWRELE
ncbi:16S rRNA pseudouridine(516) synthase [Akkermansiaceae bacterium]|nr:16S rRNA pseudouridine(516) synthase [bacterium]MDB2430573.1 16S rRNA pseudouridine(516) synthase [Akkermansiaceae bacterium]MDB4669705.1 16S rRNA pseudouridine(516) synthase [bacterium]MDB4754189.1 16S rRNA pseudouridine(516) synthase [Akkermansiaceae bacterium]MDB4759058.1 16S rRNA pseudouridine(516) synthase [Akkermansiaceae bacterium]